MKKQTAISVLVLLLTFFMGAKLSAQENAPAGRTATVKIKTTAECDMCKQRIEKEVSLMKGVKKAELDLATKVLTVEYNPKKVTPDKIRHAISEIGYDADDVKANNRAAKSLPHCCQPKADSVPAQH